MSEQNSSGVPGANRPHNPWAPTGWDDDGESTSGIPEVLEVSESSPIPAKVSRTGHPEFFQPPAQVVPDIFVTEVARSPSQPTEVAASTVSTARTDDMTVVSVVAFDVSHIREPLTYLPLEQSAPKPLSFAELVARGKENIAASVEASSAAMQASAESISPVGSTDSASGGTSTLTTPSQFGISDSFAVVVEKAAPAVEPPETLWTLKANGRSVRALSVLHGHILGRTPSKSSGNENDLLLGIEDTTGTVSRTHARLDFVEGSWMVTDLNSTNGVLVHNSAEGEHELSAGETYPVSGRFLLGDLELELVKEENHG
jgi:hypothetical protein